MHDGLQVQTHESGLEGGAIAQDSSVNEVSTDGNNFNDNDGNSSVRNCFGGRLQW